MNNNDEQPGAPPVAERQSGAPAAVRLLVGVGPGPTSADLVRATRWMAASLQASWLAVHVETADEARLAPIDQQQLTETLQMAEQFGAEVATISGTNVAE